MGTTNIATIGNQPKMRAKSSICLLIFARVSAFAPPATRRATARKSNGSVAAAIDPQLLSLDPAVLWAGYLSSLEHAPLLTKCLTAGAIFPGADLVAQSLESGRGRGMDVDIARMGRWMAFGSLVQAPWNHYWYILLENFLPSSGNNPLSSVTLCKLALDQGLQASIFTVIIFLVLGLMEGKTLGDIDLQLKKDYRSTMISNWKLWIPASFVNLAFVPLELRVLYTSKLH